jgi:hypothetical protein
MKNQTKPKHKKRERNGRYAAFPTHADDAMIACKEHGKTGAHGCDGWTDETTKPRYTAGPWFYIDMRQDPRVDGIALNAEESFQIRTRSGLEQIAKVNPFNPADARLIAAAPEMLEALKKVLALIERDAAAGQTYDSYAVASGIAHEIESLIARAEGRDE